MVAGDTVSLVGNFGEVRLSNVSYAQRTTIDASQATFTTTMVFDNVRGVALSGGTFNISGNGDYAKGIVTYGGANVYIDGVTVIGGGTINQFGISISGGSNIQVTNSKFSGLYSGIAVGGVSSAFLAKNSFTAETSDGIDIADSHRVSAMANTCSGGNPSLNAHPDCIQLWSVAGHPLQSDIVVSYNKAYGPTQGFTSFADGGGGQRLTISNNVVQTSYSQGIACYSCLDSNISYNSLSTLPGAPYQTHVSVVGGSNNTVVGNTIAPYVEPRHLGDPVDDGSGEAADQAAVLAALSPGGDVLGTTDQGPMMAGDADLIPAPAFALDDAAAVPEPSSWALLVAGFAAVGVARRRAVAGRTA